MTSSSESLTIENAGLSFVTLGSARREERAIATRNSISLLATQAKEKAISRGREGKE